MKGRMHCNLTRSKAADSQEESVFTRQRLPSCQSRAAPLTKHGSMGNDLAAYYVVRYVCPAGDGDHWLPY